MIKFYFMHFLNYKLKWAEKCIVQSHLCNLSPAKESPSVGRRREERAPKTEARCDIFRIKRFKNIDLQAALVDFQTFLKFRIWPFMAKGRYWSLELNPPIYLKTKQIKRNPSSHTHTRIFDHWKFRTLKSSDFEVFKKSPRSYTYGDF